jgi:glycosyltransferase involved in cell wall biosynthesis
MRKILIITQKVDMNDSSFGFFHDWLREFSKLAQVTVLALEVGQYDLPGVQVFSLGKDRGLSKARWLFNLYSYLWKERKAYDFVFAHMSPLFVILPYPILFLLRKKIVLWYVHRNVDLKLRIAEKLVSKVFTATKESFGITSKKVVYMGQAVDVDKFYSENLEHLNDKKEFQVITVGRITPIKNLDTLIEAVALVSKQIPIVVDIVGAPVTKGDVEYDEKLKKMVVENALADRVRFFGSIANKDLPKLFVAANASINLCPKGGLDKTVLESMASGIPVLVSNTAFKGHLGHYAEEFIFPERNQVALAEILKKLYDRTDLVKVGQYLQNQVREKSSLKHLVENIVENL